jgi:nucleotide-binding universal stress UspA family protein
VGARDPLVVVMATRAAAPVGRALRGSVADRVMRESPRPVVLVPPGSDDMRGRHVHVGRVLVPLDGSALSSRAVDFLFALPHAARLEYVLLEAVAHGGAWGAADARLDAEARRLRARGAAVVETAVVESAEPAAAIVEAVREALADAIVMSTRGASGARRMVLGSVATEVVRRSEVPVLLLTPACLGAAEGPPPEPRAPTLD